MRQHAEEFSFYAENSTHHHGDKIRIEGRGEAGRNPL
jgi:hypothetical protein